MVIIPFDEDEDTITPITVHSVSRQQIQLRTGADVAGFGDGWGLKAAVQGVCRVRVDEVVFGEAGE